MKLRHGFSSGDGPLWFSHSFGGPAPFRRRPFLQNHQVRGQRAARGGEGAGLASQGSQVRLSSGGRVGASKRFRHAGEGASVGDGGRRARALASACGTSASRTRQTGICSERGRANRCWRPSETNRSSDNERCRERERANRCNGHSETHRCSDRERSLVQGP